MKFSALSFVPAYTVLYIVSSTSVGLFFYQEWKQLNGTQWGMFSLGFALILASLVILAFKSGAAGEAAGPPYDEQNDLKVEEVDEAGKGGDGEKKPELAMVERVNRRRRGSSFIAFGHAGGMRV